MTQVLVVDDVPAMAEQYAYDLKRVGGYHTIVGRGGDEALDILAREPIDCIVLDLEMPGVDGFEVLRRLQRRGIDTPVIVYTGTGNFDRCVQAVRLGAYGFVDKAEPIERVVQEIENAVSRGKLVKEVRSLRSRLDDDTSLVGDSEKMRSLREAIARVAPIPSSVLIVGESGTGKELVARAIYHHSRRAEQPFLAINCAAIPEQLLESELFGHERGAFTGANVQRIGKFEQCNYGTIFLDEIGDMPLGPQTKILRVLQNGTFERVGGNQPIKVDVRVIAATNKPLEQAVANKTFREDLFYRLNVVRIELPALRNRPEDIPLLVNYFLKKYAQRQKQRPKSISADVLSALEHHHWPGNVRELENVVQRALVVAKGDAILPGDLPAEILGHKPAASKPSTTPAATADDLPGLARVLFHWARRDSKLKIIPAVERELIVEALKETRGNQVQAAKLLGITRATLRKRVEKFGIKQELEVK